MAVLMRPQKDVKSAAVENASIILENMNTTLVGMGMLKVLTVRSQQEMRNILETGEKAILVIQQQKTWLNLVPLLHESRTFE